MKEIKKTLRIASTNWIHLVGFYVTTYLSLILFKLVGLEGSENDYWNVLLFLSLLTIPLLFFTYGLIIIASFFGAILLLDSIGFNLKIQRTRLILIFQWIIIIPPFIFWAFEYEYWLWLSLCLSFLVTQLIREKTINKILSGN